MDHHLLAKLWDDTLAGPVPDLGHSTRPSSFSSSSSSCMRGLDDVGKVGGQRESQRSIMIMRPPIEIIGNNPMSESPPVSPAGSLSPSSQKEEEIYGRHPFGPWGAYQKKRGSGVRGSRRSHTSAYHV